MPRETHTRLLALRDRSGVPLGRLILCALGQLELEVDTARALGYEEGHKDGMTAGYLDAEEEVWADALIKYRLTFPCARCGEDIEVAAKSKAAAAATAWLHQQRWIHPQCLPPTSPPPAPPPVR